MKLQNSNTKISRFDFLPSIPFHIFTKFVLFDKLLAHAQKQKLVQKLEAYIQKEYPPLLWVLFFKLGRFGDANKELVKLLPNVQNTHKRLVTFDLSNPLLTPSQILAQYAKLTSHVIPNKQLSVQPETFDKIIENCLIEQSLLKCCKDEEYPNWKEKSIEEIFSLFLGVKDKFAFDLRSYGEKVYRFVQN